MKCEKCGKKVGIFTSVSYTLSSGEEIVLCEECLQFFRGIEEIEKIEKQKKELEEIIAKAPKIKCPYCEKWFPKLTNEQYRDSAELNVLKWAIVPAWGVVGALKNKPYIECPHCKMKIMQG
jgi:ribosome-binding protein aMBF1 (putative translation factor)